MRVLDFGITHLKQAILLPQVARHEVGAEQRVRACLKPRAVTLCPPLVIVYVPYQMLMQFAAVWKMQDAVGEPALSRARSFSAQRW